MSGKVVAVQVGRIELFKQKGIGMIRGFRCLLAHRLPITLWINVIKALYQLSTANTLEAFKLLENYHIQGIHIRRFRFFIVEKGLAILIILKTFRCSGPG